MREPVVAIDARQGAGWTGEEGAGLLALLAGGVARLPVVAYADREAAYELRARFAGRLEVRYWAGRFDDDVAALHAPFAEPAITDPDAALPLLYEPGALSHRHCPDLFAGAALGRREAAVGRAVARAAHLVVPSRAAAADLATQYGVGPDRVEVIRRRPVIGTPRPLDLEPFLLCPMPVTAEMDHGLLVEAMDRLERRYGPAPPVLCIGRADPVALARFLDALRDRGLDRRVRFLGEATANHRASLFAAARAVVYLPRWTAEALPVLEARVAGRPVIAPRLPAVEEAASDGPALVGIAPADADALCEALRGAWRDGAPSRPDPLALPPDPADRYAAVYRRLLAGA